MRYIKYHQIIKWFPYIILIFSIIINIGFYHRYYSGTEVKGGTANTYYEIGKAISNGKYETERGVDIGALLMPGFPAVVAFFYSLFNNQTIYLYIFQAVFSIVALLFLYSVLNKKLSSIIALLAVGWLMLYYPLWRYNFYMLKESLTASLFLISLYTLNKYFQFYKGKYLYLFVLIFTVIIYLYNRFIAHYAIFIGFLGFLYLLRQIPIKQIGISIGITILLLLPWHIRQYLVYDQLVIIAPERVQDVKKGIDKGNEDIFSQGKFASYQEYMDQIKNSGFSEERVEYAKKHFTREKFEEMKANYNAFEGFNKYWSRFKGFFEIYPKDFRFGFGGDVRIWPPPSTIRKITLSVLLAPMFVFMLVGIFFAFRKKDYFFISLAVFLASHIALHTYIHYIVRYRVTIIPVIFILGWYGIYMLLLKSKLIDKINVKYF